MSLSHWSSELGLQVLGALSKLYTSLVWKSTVLLALCSEDTLLADMERVTGQRLYWIQRRRGHHCHGAAHN